VKNPHSKNLRAALNAIRLPAAEWIGLRQVREVTTHRYVRDGKPQVNETSDSQGIMVEVLAHGQFAYAASPRTDLESISDAATRAYEQAKRGAPWAVHPFTQAQRPAVQKDYFSPFETPVSRPSPKDVSDLLVEISEKLKISPQIIRTGAFAQTVDADVYFVSTNGSDAYQKFSTITTDFEATAQNGSVIQKRTDAGLRGKSYQGGLEYFLNTSDLWIRVARVAEQAIELAHADECPTDTTSLVIMPDQMMLQIHESIGHPLELDRILGDERNYAGWSFVGLEDFGQLQYGSPLMNVTFDPTVPNEFASYAFDDTGNSATREHLIKDGILLRGLGSLESQARGKVSGVANARASSWNRAPIDRMGNINLESGTSSMNEIIGSVEKGILMQSNRSWSIDDFRNKFQFGCEYARLIENGKLTRVVRNPNYRGVTLPFWRSLKKVGDPSTLGIFGTPYCGKGEPNQIIRVGHASPVCLFENVEVFGGGK
jgi:predicted Zn-dependent protease